MNLHVLMQVSDRSSEDDSFTTSIIYQFPLWRPCLQTLPTPSTLLASPFLGSTERAKIASDKDRISRRVTEITKLAISKPKGIEERRKEKRG